jgi:rRNA maturation endonuclease Nob1
MEIIAGLIGLVSLIVFFVMAAALANISKNLKNVNRILVAWTRETGIGLITQCKKCHRGIHGKVDKCPHCGEKVEW